MAAGLNDTLTKATINAQGGQILATLNATMDQVQAMAAFLATQGSAGLVSNFGFVSGDADKLISAVNDADKVRQVYQGLIALTPAADQRTFIKQVIGTGVH